MGYAFKKDAKGERHGTPAERLLAEQMRKTAAAQSRPNTLFAMGMPSIRNQIEVHIQPHI